MTTWASSLVSRGASHVTGTFLRPRTLTRNFGFWTQNAPTTRATTSQFPSGLLRAHNKALFCSTGSSANTSSRIMTTATDSQHEYVKPTDYRLPTNVRPTHYDLTFKTDLESLKFWGYAIIECVSQISIIILLSLAELTSTLVSIFSKTRRRSHSMPLISIC
jgi:hypothetical protein